MLLTYKIKYIYHINILNENKQNVFQHEINNMKFFPVLTLKLNQIIQITIVDRNNYKIIRNNIKIQFYDFSDNYFLNA